MQNLSQCFNPKSIAVIGGREAERVIQQCQKMGYAGYIWAVNPRRESIGGVSCVSTINQLPGVPDIAFVAIPAAPSVDCIRELAEMGAGGVICYASGFQETGDNALHLALIDAAGSMPVVGPNCYGFINAMTGAALWPDQHGLSGCDRGVAIFSSSGNVSVNFTMQQRSLDIALIVTVGNQAMVSIEHCIEAVLNDDRITAIGIHIEGLSELDLFTDLCCRAAKIGKPIIALKTGRSSLGARITMSHTATMAGQASLYDELFSRLGVGQTNDVESFLEALKLVSIVGPLKGNRIASMSCSGGEASLIADLTEHRDLDLPVMGIDHVRAVQGTLNEFVSVGNPLDYHTFIWGDESRMFATFSAMLDGNYDLTLLILDYPCANECDISEWVIAGKAFAKACNAENAKGAILVTMAENVSESVRRELIDAGIAPLMGMHAAMDAIEAAARICQIEMPLPELNPLIPDYKNSKTQTVSEHRAKLLLSAAGMDVAKGQVVQSSTQGVEVAKSIGFPVAIKISGENIAHKSELNGVGLNLQSETEVLDFCNKILPITGEALVEKMASDGVAELLLGINYDQQFGQYLVIGFGGTLVELIADSEVMLLPVSDQQISAAINRLKIGRLIEGYRGQNKGDLSAVLKTVQCLIKFADTHRSSLLEADINPLIVSNHSAVVADALLVFKASSEISQLLS